MIDLGKWASEDYRVAGKEQKPPTETPDEG